MHDLAKFTMTDMAELGVALRGAGAGARCLEEVANRVVHCLYDQLRDVQTGGPACALIRFYKTHPYGQLPKDLQRFAGAVAGTASLASNLACLTMLATIGDKPAWNVRSRSERHQAVPLLSEEMIQGKPMISRLVAQLGLDIRYVLEPDPAFLMDLGQHSFNVFYVPQALGSPYIPAQEEFVIPERIESVLGFGGLLPSGNLFAIIFFSRVPIPQATADMFKTLALNVKLAVLPFDGSVFAPPQTTETSTGD
ncbi:MAG: hypothetical protein HY270_18925 [Deltaproteobacteria bacterium]|nr:hypothetical protein [Deltaproteobacteria bacterium]